MSRDDLAESELCVQGEDQDEKFKITGHYIPSQKQMTKREVANSGRESEVEHMREAKVGSKV